jgi:c-di-GMP-binding flagellar brake protein YcgR
MHVLNDSEMENWHDYEVESRREVITLLKSLGENHQLIRMLVHGEADVAVTSILAVDVENNAVVLDRSINPEQNARALVAKRIAFETTLDKIRILFSSEHVSEVMFEDAPALKIAIPASMIRLQRREYYRMPTPVSNPVRVMIPLPEELGGGVHPFPLSDISCGGIAIFDHKLILDNTIGLNYPGCRLDLPEVGPVTTTLQIRNSLDLTLLNNKTNRRLGCEFIELSRGNMNNVQRYITKLERERNARIAGLG